MGLAPNNYAKDDYLDVELKFLPGWQKLLLKEFDEPYMLNLYAFLEERLFAGANIFPREGKYLFRYPFFKALELTDYKDVKVAILGQDPYPTIEHANGLAFAVNENTPLPPSLKNIFKEIGTEPKDRTLVSWAKQGVLLLNTVLSVEENSPACHRGKGWEIFTDKIISLLNARNEGITFMLWGKDAQKKESLISNKQHKILKTSHPSPLAVYQGFDGCGHFKEVSEIDWVN